MYFGMCQHCKTREATHSHTSIINGEVLESRLCDECYQEIYGALDGGFSMWSDILSDPKPVVEKRCNVCGMRFSEYQRTGLLGCPSCYDLFKEELLPVIQKIQGGVTHVGKVGKHYTSHDYSRRIAVLQQKLESAVRSKNYAEADRLNKLIIDLTRQMNGGSDD